MAIKNRTHSHIHTTVRCARHTRAHVQYNTIYIHTRRVTRSGPQLPSAFLTAAAAARIHTYIIYYTVTADARLHIAWKKKLYRRGVIVCRRYQINFTS